MKCSEIEAMLPAYAGEGETPLSLRRHLARCADCRAELSQLEQMSSALRSLPALTVEPPASLRAALVSIPTEASRLEALRAHVSRNRKAYTGLAVTAVGAAGAALWRTRRTRIAPA